MTSVRPPMVSLVLWDDEGPEVAPFGEITLNLDDSFGSRRKSLWFFFALGITARLCVLEKCG
jgi:hypothetical protein